MKNANRTHRRYILVWVFRVFFAFLLFLFIFNIADTLYIRPLVSLFQSTMKTLHPDYHFKSLDYIHHGENARTISIDARIHRNWMDGNGNTGYGRIVRGNYPVDTLLVQPILVFTILLAWPYVSLTNRFKALTIAVPGMLFIFFLDIPPSLIYTFEKDLVADSISTDFIHVWIWFLRNGGRLLLTVLLIIISALPLYSEKSEKRVRKGVSP